MSAAMCPGRGRLPRIIGVLFVVAALAGPAARQPAVAAAQADDDAAADELTELWSFDTEGAITSDPFVVDGVVYVRSNDGAVFAVDAATGEERWQAPTWARGFEPSVAEGILFTAEFDEDVGAGRLIALDVANEGEERWSADLDGEPVGRPAVTASGLVLVSTLHTPEEGAATSRLMALDLEDGAEQWSIIGSRFGIENFLFADEMIWFAAGTQLLALDADGRLRWIVEMLDPIGRLFYLDGVLYGSITLEGTIYASSVFARDAATGENLWSTVVPFDLRSDVAVLAVDERTMYLSNPAEAENDVIVAFDPDLFDEENKAARWIVDGVPGLLAALVAEGGFVYAGTNHASDDDPGAVVVLDAETGETVAQAAVPAFAVTVADGVVYTGWGDGVLHAFRIGATDEPAQAEDEDEDQDETDASAADEDATLDLAAMTLTPADLDAEGLAGYGLGFGQTFFPDEVIASTAESRGLDEDEVRETLEDAGFARRYDSYLYLPEDEADPAGVASRMVVSYVLEFADEDGAAAAWDLIEDESGNDAAEDVELGDVLGDQSEATREEGEDPATGDVFAQIDVTFRLGNLLAGVALVDWQGEEPELAEAEALAERLLERVEEAGDAAGSRLGGQVVRLAGDDLIPSADYYLLRDGEAIPLYGEAPADTEARDDAAADLDQTDGYRLWQQIATGDDGDNWYLVELQQFEDEDAAADWLAGVEDRIEANDGFDDFEIDEVAPTFGDESIAFTVESDDFAYRSVVLRVGAVVASIDVLGPETPPADVVEELAAAQAACLEDGGCLEPASLPNGLGAADDEDADADEDDRDQDDRDDEDRDADEDDRDQDDRDGEDAGETASSAATDGDSYVSPTWGYAVTWDPAAWEAKDRPGEDGIELHLMGGFLVGGFIRGLDGYDGDPEACLAGMIEEAAEQTDSPVTPADDLPAPETAGEAAGALLRLGDFGVVYFECRSLVEGEAVLQVRLGAPVGDYEAVLPELEELLAGIETP